MRQKMLICFLLIYRIAHSQGTMQKDTLMVPPLTFDSNGILKVYPSPTSSKNDFDFFQGKWKLKNKILKVAADGEKQWNEFDATQEMHIILKGIGNVDNFIAIRDGNLFEGMTLRLFNPQTKLWSIYWADSKYGTLYLPPVTGSFENKVGHFFSQDEANSEKLITVYRWDVRDTEKPIWSQATSKDKGKTWEWNWFMYMTKSK